MFGIVSELYALTFLIGLYEYAGIYNIPNNEIVGIAVRSMDYYFYHNRID